MPTTRRSQHLNAPNPPLTGTSTSARTTRITRSQASLAPVQVSHNTLSRKSQHKSGGDTVNKRSTHNQRSKQRAVESEDDGYTFEEEEEEEEWGGIDNREASPDMDPAIRAELDAEWEELERDVQREIAAERHVTSTPPNPHNRMPAHDLSDSEEEPINFATCALPELYDMSLDFRVGDKTKGSNRKIGALPPVTFKLESRKDTYNQLIVCIIDLVAAKPGYEFPVDARPYLVPSKTTAQRDFTELTELNFLQMFEMVWRREAKKK